MQYQTAQIEENARKKWNAFDVYKTSNDFSKPKYYVLDMFPYPSGAGLHVGHPLGYVASDIFSRYKRQKGFNVLHPMGFDAFGLPAEQYAIETGQHPAVTTDACIEIYKKQLDNLGLSFDWSREVKTCAPEYVKWTQWIFIQLFNSCYCTADNNAQPLSVLIAQFEQYGNLKTAAFTTYTEKFTAQDWKSYSEKQQSDILMHYRLAYVDYAEVNWCEALGTVLANDEVVNGKSVRGGHPVERKKMRQWFLRITAYADRLLQNLEKIDWSESIKDQQRNWIGRSEGAEIDFQILDTRYETQDVSSDSNLESNILNLESIKVFTTRPDTVFGVTFMVLAPEHELVSKITTEAQKAEIESYLAYCKSRTDVDRQQEKKVTGAFTGAYVKHPFTGKNIPVYIAEYVLAGYGTGAIMAVPADDERDQRFAEKFGIDVIPVVDKSMYPNATLDDKLGKIINSDFLNGMEVKDAISLMCDRVDSLKIGKKKINFKLRDANFSRQRYWGEPFPILWKEGIPYTVKEQDLPIVNPPVDEFKPSKDGRSPLARNEAWVKEVAGYERETDTMPGFAGSSWYFLRYMDAQNPQVFVAEDAVKYWQQVDLYVGGSEHAVGHLMYARFWNMFLFDLGYVPTEEPFKKLINQGMIQGRSNFVYRSSVNPNIFVSKNKIEEYTEECNSIHVDVNIVHNDELDVEAFKKWRPEYENATFIADENGKYICGWEIEKMSKSKYNVVNPDDVVSKYGADCFRMFEMFLGPVEMSKPWNTSSIEGVSRFLRKFWNLYYDENGQSKITNEVPTPEEYKILHKTIKKVTEDIERFSFNTAVSACMVCTNELAAIKCTKKDILKELVVVIAPMAPHIAENLWELFDNQVSVVNYSYPVYDESYLKESEIEYPVSINGKTRTKIVLPLDATAEAVEKLVKEGGIVDKWLDGKTVKKVIFVPNRMINVVI